MWSSYAILIGDRERQRGTYGRTNDLQVNRNEPLGEWMWYMLVLWQCLLRWLLIQVLSYPGADLYWLFLFGQVCVLSSCLSYPIVHKYFFWSLFSTFYSIFFFFAFLCLGNISLLYISRLLYPFLYGWTFRLLSWPGYCK